jgi:hypothetical protein
MPCTSISTACLSTRSSTRIFFYGAADVDHSAEQVQDQAEIGASAKLTAGDGGIEQAGELRLAAGL